jgi:hypothetical protein
MEMSTLAFSSMVSWVFDEKDGGMAKTQDVPMSPSVCTQESRWKGGAFGSSDSSDLSRRYVINNLKCLFNLCEGRLLTILNTIQRPASLGMEVLSSTPITNPVNANDLDYTNAGTCA